MIIKTRKELKHFLECDKKNLRMTKRRPKLIGKDVANEIWKYEILLRKYEYHLNNNHKIRSLVLKVLLNKKGITLGIDIPANVFSSGLAIIHCGGIVVSPKCKIGSNCMLYQNVTIGEEKSCAPVIGDNVCILPGAKVFGNIKIGSNVMVGANSVVNKDVPNNARVVGVPAKTINYNGNEYSIEETL